MRIIARSLAGAVAGVLLLGSAAGAADAGICTHESWNVDGSPLAATFCVPVQRTPRVTVSESFARGGQSFSRSLDIDVVSGADVSRAVDTVSLVEAGTSKQLHLTIAYRNGVAVVEHALLLPGAVVLK